MFKLCMYIDIRISIFHYPHNIQSQFSQNVISEEIYCITDASGSSDLFQTTSGRSGLLKIVCI